MAGIRGATGPVGSGNNNVPEAGAGPPGNGRVGAAPGRRRTRAGASGEAETAADPSPPAEAPSLPDGRPGPPGAIAGRTAAISAIEARPRKRKSPAEGRGSLVGAEARGEPAITCGGAAGGVWPAGTACGVVLAGMRRVALRGRLRGGLSASASSWAGRPGSACLRRRLRGRASSASRRGDRGRHHLRRRLHARHRLRRRPHRGRHHLRGAGRPAGGLLRGDLRAAALDAADARPADAARKPNT